MISAKQAVAILQTKTPPMTKHETVCHPYTALDNLVFHTDIHTLGLSTEAVHSNKLLFVTAQTRNQTFT